MPIKEENHIKQDIAIIEMLEAQMVGMQINYFGNNKMYYNDK